MTQEHGSAVAVSREFQRGTPKHPARTPPGIMRASDTPLQPIAIRRGFAASAFGSVKVKTPSFNSAFIPD